MTRLQRSISTLAIWWLAASLVAGPGGISVRELPQGVEHELEPTASKLGLPPARLLEARLALRRATEAADFVQPHRAVGPSWLIAQWLRLEEDNAQQVLLRALRVLLDQAAEAADDREYRYATLYGTRILDRLSQLDPSFDWDPAQWPAPHAELGVRAREVHQRLEAYAASLVLERQPDSEAAAELLEARPEMGFSYWARTRTALKLHYGNSTARAFELVRDGYSDFATGELGRERALDFASSLWNVARISLTLFDEGHEMLRSRLPDLPDDGTSCFKQALDASWVEFSWAEVYYLRSLRTLLSDPKAFDLRVARWPGLSGRVKAVGDSAAVGLAVSNLERPKTARQPAPDVTSAREETDRPGDWLALPQEEFLQRVRERFRHLDRFDQLLGYGSAVYGVDAEKGEQVFRLAEEKIAALPSMQQQAYLWSKALPAMGSIRGAISQQTIARAVRLLEKIKQVDWDPELGKAWFRDRDRFEFALLAEWARLDWELVHGHIQKHDDREFRYKAYRAVVVVLTRPEIVFHRSH